MSEIIINHEAMDKLDIKIKPECKGEEKEERLKEFDDYLKQIKGKV